jgi:ribosomal protein L40E
MGLSGFMPQNDPDAKAFLAQNTLNDLHQQQEQIYAKIGKKALPALTGNAEYADLLDELRVVQKKLVEATSSFEAAQAEKEAAKQELENACCPECGYENPAGSKFCQSCGAKLGDSLIICQSCGAKNKAGTRFCGECGNKL